MSKLNLFNGVTYPIADYATPKSFVILLGYAVNGGVE